MPVTVTTAPALEPVTLSELRLQCRVDSTDENALLTSLGVAAREQVESLTGRALITRSLLLLTSATGGVVSLPCPPLQLPLTSVQTIDEERDATFASGTIGSGTNGTVTVTADTAGVGGNLYKLQVALGVGVGVAMSAAFAPSPTILVTLGTDGAGALDPAKNTATLVAAAITALAGVSAVASGTGASPLTAASAATALTGGFGTLTTVAAADYELNMLHAVPTIAVTYRTAADTLRVAYDAGYGDAAADVPQALKQAILLLAAYWYSQREAVAGTELREVPYAVQALCSQYRVQHFGTGVEL